MNMDQVSFMVGVQNNNKPSQKNCLRTLRFMTGDLHADDIVQQNTTPELRRCHRIAATPEMKVRMWTVSSWGLSRLVGDRFSGRFSGWSFYLWRFLLLGKWDG
jgi:hypothetical protein